MENNFITSHFWWSYFLHFWFNETPLRQFRKKYKYGCQRLINLFYSVNYMINCSFWREKTFCLKNLLKIHILRIRKKNVHNRFLKNLRKVTYWKLDYKKRYKIKIYLIVNVLLILEYFAKLWNYFQSIRESISMSVLYRPRISLAVIWELLPLDNYEKLQRGKRKNETRGRKRYSRQKRRDEEEWR